MRRRRPSGHPPSATGVLTCRGSCSLDHRRTRTIGSSTEKRRSRCTRRSRQAARRVSALDGDREHVLAQRRERHRPLDQPAQRHQAASFSMRTQEWHVVAGRPQSRSCRNRAGAQYRLSDDLDARPAPPTGRACLHASSSPRAMPAGSADACVVLVHGSGLASSVAIPGGGDLGGVGTAHPALRRPPVWQVATAELLPGDAGGCLWRSQLIIRRTHRMAHAP